MKICVAVLSAAVLCSATTSLQTPPKYHRYLSSFAYTIDNTAPAHGQMWTADDFITKDAGTNKERAWQNLILVTGNDTYFAQISAEVLNRTGQSLPMLWYWGGWRFVSFFFSSTNCCSSLYS
jgi:hypothetical protein